MSFNILSLDGGGSKGIYTIGILNELEQKLGTQLSSYFHLIYGTSTGSIIASLIGIGKTVQDIKDLYFQMVPKIMSAKGTLERSVELKKYSDAIFSDLKFEVFKTHIGIVSMNFDDSKPLIFKTNKEQTYSMKSTFLPGFGCTISEAIQASCAAYPLFLKKDVTTENQGKITTIDGGYIANNPTLLAITDAISALNRPLEDLSVISLGTGNFIEKKISRISSFFKKLKYVQLVERVLEASAKSTEIQAKILFPKLRLLRINDTFNQPQYGTNMLEASLDKLNTLFRLGRESFSKAEGEIEKLLLC